MQRVRRWEYASETKAVRAFLRLHKEHPGVRTCTAWFQSLLDRAASGDNSVVAFEHFRRLSTHGVTGARILEELCAMALFESREHFTRFANDRAYSYSLVDCVLRLAPMDYVMYYDHSTGRQKKRTHRAEGKWKEDLAQMIRDGAGAFLRHVAAAIEEQRIATSAQRDALKQPFRQTSTEKDNE